LILGIETSTRVCSVALADADRVVVEYTLNAGVHHAERLVPMVTSVLEQADRAPADLSGVAVASGPGSFTGLRIGMSTAKGLCAGAGLALIAVPTLEALAHQASPQDVAVCPVLDARRGQVYAGLYRCQDGRLVRLAPDGVVDVADLARQLPRPVLLLGEGAEAYRDEIACSLGEAAQFAPAHLGLPRAGQVALLGARKAAAGDTEDLSDAEPLYLRRSQAERARAEGPR
jgi:tRNA threonylcarbamoyladenosine biosynthesis protein TsaB